MRQRVEKILKSITAGAYEREEAMALTLLAAMAGESIFMLGLPGVGKSMMARRLKLAFDNARVFEYLMSRFSTPDEIFGPVSISKLKDEDCYERVTDGYLPEAEVVFLDEIWKAGPAIQNSLLTVLNEKIYLNGHTTMSLPVKGIIAASNELPAEGEGLEALWDRFLIRYIVEPIHLKKNFMRMLDSHDNSIVPTVDKPITDKEYHEIKSEIANVKVPDSIKGLIFELRSKMNDKNRNKDVEPDVTAPKDSPIKYYVSDRRWKKSIGILKASAYLNGREEVNLSDTILLSHILWNNDADINEISGMLSDEIASCLFSDLISRYNELKRSADKASKDNSIYSPDGIHYLIQCDDFMLKIKQTDYEKIKSKYNEIFFASESVDESLVFRSRGQYTVRFTKDNFVGINGYNYPLLTVAGSILDSDFFKNLPEALEDKIDELNKEIDNNLFVCSNLLRRNLKNSAITIKNRVIR